MNPDLLASYPRICITSTGGGGGKTLLSLGLCRAFRQAGLDVKPFKKGPDYIDAAWLTGAAAEPATCLDPFFMDGPGLRKLFSSSMAGHDLAIIEGNRGLFDGLNESGVCSTSQVARSLECPIIICIDCAKSTRTIAAVLNGLANFEPGLDFAGVVLNRVGSPRHASSLRAAINANTELKILGCLPRL
ncbi:MAG: AAA family ATPase, partial [Desulfovibrio sp.]|nr:AAA family ATPase [Desulfovibrio sp.]